WASTKPGQTTLPVASMTTRAVAPVSLPTAATRSPLTPRSPLNHGLPVPSMTRPLLMRTSNDSRMVMSGQPVNSLRGATSSLYPAHSSPFLADVELQLPALPAVTADAPQFQRADLRNLAQQMDRHDLTLPRLRLQSRRERTEFLDLPLPLLHQ